jgi:hypothetical protein
MEEQTTTNIRAVSKLGLLGDGFTWTVEEAFQQFENPDVAINMTPPPGGMAPLDPDILLDILNLAGVMIDLLPVPGVSNVFNLISALINIATIQSSAIENETDQASIKTYIMNLSSSLTGMNDNVNVLKLMDASAKSPEYVDHLISLNTYVTGVMPQFQQDIYRRWATILFMTGATIHLNTLRALIDSVPTAKQAYTDVLRSNAAKYIAWLKGTKVAILDAREADIGPLVGSGVTYIKDSFKDNRLVGGNMKLIYVAPATTAPQSRVNYIARRRVVFSQSDWMQNIDACIITWQQVMMLCDLTDPNTFAAMPEGAIFPGIGSGGSYLDLADRVAWSGANVLKLRVHGTWFTLNVPAANQSVAVIDVGGTPTAPTFFVDNGAESTVGLAIQQSNVWAGTGAGAGMILLDTVKSNCILAAFNIMLNVRDQGSPGQPVAIVCDSLVDKNGNQTITIRQTSAIIGFSPSEYSQQSVALETPMPVQVGQLVGFVNTGPSALSLNWVDGPGHHVAWIGISPTVGWSITLPAGSTMTPTVACGWNFTSYADVPA